MTHAPPLQRRLAWPEPTAPRPVALNNEGAARRDDALERHEAHRAGWLRRARRMLLLRLLAGGTATADDVHDICPPPEGIDPTVCGAVPRDLARSGIIARAGYAPSTRPEAHARPITVWRLADRVAAQAWLAAHPADEGEA